MHVRVPDGSWKKGFEAWLVLLRVLPKLAWLGKLASVPPMRWIGPSIYKIVARNRYSIPGVPARCDGDTCAIARIGAQKVSDSLPAKSRR
jgi:predicted DCC family thiol-disulfide oxidoreductase YuxK